MKINDIITDNFQINGDVVLELPDIVRLTKTPHSQILHQEGNPWEHTILAYRELFQLMFYRTDYEHDHTMMDCKVLLCAMLLHDIGKGLTTYFDKEKNDYACKNHGAIGAKLAREILLDEDITLRERVCRLVRWHMALHHILEKPQMDNEMIRLSKGYVEDSFYELWLMTYADSLGSINKETREKKDERFNRIKEYAEKIGCFKSQIKTKDLNKFVPECFTLNVMIGLPGSGKDTFIETLQLIEPLYVLCRDDIRKEIGLTGDKPMGNKKQENLVTQILEDRLVQLSKTNATVFINNTNLMRKYRERYKELTKDNPPFVINYYYIETPNNPVEDCIKRRIGQIPPSVIDDMWDRFEFPDPSECDNLYLLKQLY